MKKMKKLVCSILIMSLFVGLGLPGAKEKVAEAANTSGTFAERIAQLQQKFPAGKYWNHMGSSSNNANGYTSTPCGHHGNCSKNDTDYSGWCGCNSYNGGIQCHGFAMKLGYDVFGTNPRTWQESKSLANVQPGDIIRYKSNKHSIFVTGVSGDTITYADCNSDGNCKIRWNATIQKSQITGLTYVWHAYNYGDISVQNGGTNAGPANVPSINNVKINSIDSGHISLSFSTQNSGLVRIVTTSKTTGQKITTDYTSGLNQVNYTFRTSSMSNPGKRFSVYIYCYSTVNGGNEQLHRVLYGSEADTVTLPERSMHHYIDFKPDIIVAGVSPVTGWVIGENIQKVTVVVNNAMEYECIRVKRADVGEHYPGYDCSKAGFSYNLSAADLNHGTNSLKVRAYVSATEYVEICNTSVNCVKLEPRWFDWSWYYFKYHNIPEVAAIGKNPGKLMEYYYEKGIALGHSPCLGFDPAYYLSANKDIAKAYNNSVSGAYEHFILYCLPSNEKRVLSPYLNLDYYQKMNIDLSKMNAADLFNHHCLYGKYEIRRGNNTHAAGALNNMFYTKEYAALNKDIKNQMGDGATYESAEAIWSHFWTFALSGNEPRWTRNGFNMEYYMTQYNIKTTENAFWNYTNTGYKNGYGTTAPKQPAVHIHEYNSEWKSNFDGHWKECDCGEQESLTNHSFDEWIETDNNNGMICREKTCTVCKYVKRETIIQVSIEPTEAPTEPTKETEVSTEPTKETEAPTEPTEETEAPTEETEVPTEPTEETTVEESEEFMEDEEYIEDEEEYETIEKEAPILIYSNYYQRTNNASTFSLNVKQIDGDGDISYSSSNTKVATVTDRGRVRIHSAGICIVTVKVAETEFYKSYTGKIVIQVKPKKMAVKSVKTGKNNKLSIKWNRDKSATGYILQCSTSRKFTKKTTKNIVLKKKSIVAAKINKIAKNKKHYVRICAYKTVEMNGETLKLCGEWSKARAVK